MLVAGRWSQGNLTWTQSQTNSFNACCNYCSPWLCPFFLMTEESGEKVLSLILSVLNKRVTANIKVIAGFLRSAIKSHKSSHGTPVLTLYAMLVVLNLSGINNGPITRASQLGNFLLAETEHDDVQDSHSTWRSYYIWYGESQTNPMIAFCKSTD